MASGLIACDSYLHRAGLDVMLRSSADAMRAAPPMALGRVKVDAEFRAAHPTVPTRALRDTTDPCTTEWGFRAAADPYPGALKCAAAAEEDVRFEPEDRPEPLLWVERVGAPTLLVLAWEGAKEALCVNDKATLPEPEPGRRPELPLPICLALEPNGKGTAGKLSEMRVLPIFRAMRSAVSSDT